MISSNPNFRPYPFELLPRISHHDAAIESSIARWIAARPLGPRVAELAGGPVRARLVGRVGERTGDPNPALAEVRIAGRSIVLAAASRPVRALAQRLLGGPSELDAHRPPTTIEHAIWALAIAAAIEDTGIAAEVWPIADPPRDAFELEIAIDLAGTAMTVIALCPRDLALRAPPARPIRDWAFDVPIVVARCAIRRSALRALAIRDVIVVAGELGLVIGDGTLALIATPQAVEAVVATGYVRRDMALPDESHLELTVQLGTTRMSLRQIGELAVGQVVGLGRPLAGPYEVCAAGRVVGQGELVDIDGELGVRIVSLAEE